jgi:hypothetical protein
LYCNPDWEINFLYVFYLRDNYNVLISKINLKKYYLLINNCGGMCGLIVSGWLVAALKGGERELGAGIRCAMACSRACPCSKAW